MPSSASSSEASSKGTVRGIRATAAAADAKSGVIPLRRKAHHDCGPAEAEAAELPDGEAHARRGALVAP